MKYSSGDILKADNLFLFLFELFASSPVTLQSAMNFFQFFFYLRALNEFFSFLPILEQAMYNEPLTSSFDVENDVIFFFFFLSSSSMSTHDDVLNCS